MSSKSAFVAWLRPGTIGPKLAAFSTKTRGVALMTRCSAGLRERGSDGVKSAAIARNAAIFARASASYWGEGVVSLLGNVVVVVIFSSNARLGVLLLFSNRVVERQGQGRVETRAPDVERIHSSPFLDQSVMSIGIRAIGGPRHIVHIAHTR